MAAARGGSRRSATSGTSGGIRDARDQRTASAGNANSRPAPVSAVSSAVRAAIDLAHARRSRTPTVAEMMIAVTNDVADAGRGVHLSVQYDGKRSWRATRQAPAGLIPPTSWKLPLTTQTGDTKPLDPSASTLLARAAGPPLCPLSPSDRPRHPSQPPHRRSRRRTPRPPRGAARTPTRGAARTPTNRWSRTRWSASITSLCEGSQGSVAWRDPHPDWSASAPGRDHQEHRT